MQGGTFREDSSGKTMLILSGRMDKGLWGSVDGRREQGKGRVRAPRVALCGTRRSAISLGSRGVWGPGRLGSLDFMPWMIRLLLRSFSAEKDKLSIHSESFKDCGRMGGRGGRKIVFKIFTFCCFLKIPTSLSFGGAQCQS